MGTHLSSYAQITTSSALYASKGSEFFQGETTLFYSPLQSVCMKPFIVIDY